MALAIMRTELSAADLRLAARRAKDTDQAHRLPALALVFDGFSRSEAARAAGMDRQTLRDWVIRYNAEGVEGLRDRPRQVMWAGHPAAAEGSCRSRKALTNSSASGTNRTSADSLDDTRPRPRPPRESRAMLTARPPTDASAEARSRHCSQPGGSLLRSLREHGTPQQGTGAPTTRSRHDLRLAALAPRPPSPCQSLPLETPCQRNATVVLKKDAVAVVSGLERIDLAIQLIPEHRDIAKVLRPGLVGIG